MLSLTEINQKLSGMLSPKRMMHSVNVMETASLMAKKLGLDDQKAKIAGLLHDCGKDLPKEKAVDICKKYNIIEYEKYGFSSSILHGPVGSYIAREEFGIIDIDILSSIYFHTTGKAEMTMLEKVIYLADCIEPDRKYKGVKAVRRIAEENIDMCMQVLLDKTLIDIISKQAIINLITVEARNYYLNIVKMQEK